MRILASLAVILVICSTAFSQDKSPAPAIYASPALLTSSGQAADVLILKGLCARSGVEVKYRPMATEDSLADVKSIILVAGGSSKGLGAAKADPGLEEKRIEKLLKAARKAKLPVIVFHIGGEARRGALSDPFNKIAADGGDVIIVSKGGDDDGFFKKIADHNKARYIPVENSAGTVPVLKTLFLKAPESE